MNIPKGYVKVPTSSVGIGFRRLIKEDLTIVGVNQSSFQTEPIVHKLFIDTQEYIGVPRGYYLNRLKHRGVEGICDVSDGKPYFKHNRDFELRDGQDEIINKAVEICKKNEYGGCVIEAGVGSGKCHGKGTKILMYDGSVKNVEDVLVGDQLMGPDSKPRNVLSLARGKENMYKIIPKKGEPFTCNESHILSLRLSGGDNLYKGRRHDDIYHIHIYDLKNMNKHLIRDLKLWRTGVEFNEYSFDYDPYFFGLWIADGSFNRPEITKPDIEIKEYLKKFAYDNGLIFYEKKNKQGKCPTYSISINDYRSRKGIRKKNPLQESLNDFRSDGKKRIPKKYLTSSRQHRLLLLSGIIDGDGYYGGGSYEVSCKDDGLKDDILYLARSLGFAAYAKIKKSSIKKINFIGQYWRIIISGNIDLIPCKIKRKKALPRKQKKNVLRTGFSIESIGYNDYYGFNLDGDHLYLLGDFTVTHNTILGLEISRILEKKTLIIVSTTVLLNQWKNEIKKFYPKLKVGIIQGSEVQVIGYDICIGMIQSLSLKDDYPHWIYNEFGTILVDECHLTAAQEFSKAVPKFSAKYLIGLSGTVKRSDKCESVFINIIGEILPFLNKVQTMKPHVYFIDTGFSWKGWNTSLDRQKVKYLSKLILDPSRNLMIVKQAAKAVKAGRNVLILSERVDHVNDLANKLKIELKDTVFTVGVMTGKTDEKERVESQKANIIVATIQLVGTGFNEPRLDTLIFATPYQNVTQAIGRIVRTHPNKKTPFVLDLVDTQTNVGMVFAKSRFKKYLELGYEMSGLTCFNKEFLCKYQRQLMLSQNVTLRSKN